MHNYEFSELTRKIQVTPKSLTQALKGLGVKYKEIQRVAAFRVARRTTDAVNEVQPLTGGDIYAGESEGFLQRKSVDV